MICQPAAGVPVGGRFDCEGIELLRGIYATAAAMAAEIVRQDVVANNIANVSTPGFRRDFARFEAFPEMLLQAADRAGVTLGGVAPGSAVVEVSSDMRPGAALETGSLTDVLIRGEGFFVVQVGERTAYTREGSFMAGAGGVLCTGKGHPVLGEAGTVGLQSGPFSIDGAGVVRSGDTTPGRLRIVTFDRPELLQKDGDGYFVPRPGLVASNVVAPELVPGSIELSNVNPVKEMVNLITVLRSYEAAAKALAAQDETLSKAVNELAR